MVEQSCSFFRTLMLYHIGIPFPEMGCLAESLAPVQHYSASFARQDRSLNHLQSLQFTTTGNKIMKIIENVNHAVDYLQEPNIYENLDSTPYHLPGVLILCHLML